MPGICTPVSILTHQQEAADGLHCFGLKLPSTLQSGAEPPISRPLLAAIRC